MNARPPARRRVGQARNVRTAVPLTRPPKAISGMARGDNKAEVIERIVSNDATQRILSELDGAVVASAKSNDLLDRVAGGIAEATGCDLGDAKIALATCLRGESGRYGSERVVVRMGQPRRGVS